MIEEKIVLHPAQQAIADSPAQIVVAACGRRFGKTTLAKHLLTWYANRGERCAYIAPTYEMTRRAWPDAYVGAEQQRRMMDFTSGGEILLHSANSHWALAGQFDFVVLDEAPMIAESVWQVTQRLLKPKGRALLIGTPQGKNWFYDLFVQAAARLNSQFKAFHYSTQFNPHVAEKALADLYEDMNEHDWHTEILAEFVYAKN